MKTSSVFGMAITAYALAGVLICVILWPSRVPAEGPPPECATCPYGQGIGIRPPRDVSSIMAARRRDPQRFIADHDADGDGQVSEDEFAATCRPFQRLDTDRDGSVTEPELENMTQGYRVRFLTVHDVDHDGRVSIEEFASTTFRHLDKDRDGYISAAEAPTGPPPGAGPGPELGQQPARAGTPRG